MQTQEIPRHEWRSFFDTFSLKHEGWLAAVEILGADVGAQKEVRALPLAGVSVSSGGDESETIAIDLGMAPNDHVSHAIADPTNVWLEQTDEGADAALEIEASDGTKTLLRFRSTVPAEFVDRVVLDQ
jgi:Family of unknown function (DUF5335)